MKDINPKALMTIKVVLSLMLAFASIFVLAKYASSPEFHAETIKALDDKKTTVLELTAASTAASAAITLLPGDTATPIADNLAELSSYFLLIVCAIYLEKYLVTITGYATFVVLIPAACILFAINVFWENESCKQLVRKLFVFGIAIFLVIPASVQVSNLIEATYETSINNTIESAKNATEEIEKTANDSEEAENKGIIGGLISQVQDSVSNVTKKVENVLNNFIEALAVMLITSCAIPILVLFFFVWLVKMILGVNIEVPKKEKLNNVILNKVE